VVARHDSAEKKKGGIKRSAPGFKAGAIGSSVPKTKEKKMEDERDLLKIKIGMSDLRRCHDNRLSN
jgi:hypothetical protein